MQLVEQGRLELDRPAREVVPALAEVEVLEGFDAAGQPVTRPPARPITLRHLLTHTAGFAYEIWQEPIGRYQEAKGLPGIISCEERGARGRRSCSIRASAGSTASTSTGPARWSRR